jgi:hypothetical protein
MTDPVTPAPDVLTGPQKAVVGAVLSTIALVLMAVAPFVPEPWHGVLLAISGLVGVIGVPWGVWVTTNKPKV